MTIKEGRGSDFILEQFPRSTFKTGVWERKEGPVKDGTMGNEADTIPEDHNYALDHAVVDLVINLKNVSLRGAPLAEKRT